MPFGPQTATKDSWIATKREKEFIGGFSYTTEVVIPQPQGPHNGFIVAEGQEGSLTAVAQHSPWYGGPRPGIWRVSKSLIIQVNKRQGESGTLKSFRDGMLPRGHPFKPEIRSRARETPEHRKSSTRGMN